MFGFFIGTISLFGLIAVLRRRRWHGRHGYGGYGGHGGGYGPRMMLRRLFERLETTPGQEKVIVEAIGDLKSRARDARSDLMGARHEIADAFRQESFDEVLLGGALGRIDASMDVMRKSALDAFGKVHAALDERQRKILADLVERGPRPFAGSPYRI